MDKIKLFIPRFIRKRLFKMKMFVLGKHKRKTMDKYINKYNLNIFIETGTYLGDTLFRLRNKFKELYSIELSEYYYKLAEDRFKNINNIYIIQGDSGEKLKDLLKNINDSVFFWLDGHYSAGLTAKAELETPIIQELDSIFNHMILNDLRHVILIDDARLFNGTSDYPKMDSLKDYFESKNKNYLVSIDSDIIVCEPIS